MGNQQSSSAKPINRSFQNITDSNDTPVGSAPNATQLQALSDGNEDDEFRSMTITNTNTNNNNNNSNKKKEKNKMEEGPEIVVVVSKSEAQKQKQIGKDGNINNNNEISYVPDDPDMDLIIRKLISIKKALPVIESAANPKWSSNTATSGPATEVRRRRETNPLNSTHDWSKQTLNICLDFYSLFSRISTSIAQTQRRMNLRIEETKLGATQAVAELSTKHADSIRIIQNKSFSVDTMCEQIEEINGKLELLIQKTESLFLLLPSENQNELGSIRVSITKNYLIRQRDKSTKSANNNNSNSPENNGFGNSKNTPSSPIKTNNSKTSTPKSSNGKSRIVNSDDNYETQNLSSSAPPNFNSMPNFKSEFKINNLNNNDNNNTNNNQFEREEF